MRSFSFPWSSPRQQSRRVLPLLCLGVTFAVAVACGWVLLEDRRDVTANARNAAANTAAVVAQDIARILGMYDLSLQAVAHGMEFPDLWNLPPDLRQTILFDRAASTAQFGFLNVLNEVGDVIADSQSRTPRAANFVMRDYFQALRREPQEMLYIGRPVLTGAGQTAMLPLARRRSLPEGSFAGVVVGSMRLSNVQELFASLVIGNAGSIALTRNDSVLLMRVPFNADDIGRTTPPDAPLSRFLAAGESQQAAIDPDHVARITALHRVGGLPLVISVGLAESDVYRMWWRRAEGLLTAILLLCCLDASLIYVFRRAERERLRAEAAAHHAEAERTRTIATVSHELRTPLTSVLGYAEMLAGTPDLSPVQAGQVAALSQSALQLRMFVDRLVDYTRADALIRSPVLISTDLDLLVAQCRTLMEPEAAAKGLTLTCQLDPGPPKWVNIDPNQVSRVLINLLSSAVKEVPHGAVRLTVSGDATQLHCEVAGTGLGIPTYPRARLFKEFDSLDPNRNVPGCGTELSIAARLIKGMDGTIGHGENPRGENAFWFEIPISELAPPALPTFAQAAVRTRRFLHILLAEDSPANRDVTVTFLQDAGHQVTTAGNGAEALHIAASEDFDLIITDTHMPRMSGLEAARRIRGLAGRRSRTPILLLTGDTQLARQPATDEGLITLSLPKPYTRHELLAAVSKAATPAIAADFDRDPPLVDEDAFNQLASLGPDNVDAHLRVLSGRIADLIAMLRDPDMAGAESLSDVMDEVGSASRLLGFAALSDALCREGQASNNKPAGAVTAGLIAVAEASLAALNCRLAESPPTHTASIAS